VDILMRQARGDNVDHRSRSGFGAANTVTALRAALVAFLAGFVVLWPATPTAAWYEVALGTAAAVLDAVDGWVARRAQTMTAFGARFDMETDAALILALSILVWLHGKAGVWVLLCGLMRYLFVASGWVLPWMARPLRPTMRGKTVAVVQFIGLIAALSPVVPPALSRPIAAATLAALVWSFSIDVMRLARS
jgi:phosphatidylglycerophosphate synthase